MKFSSLMKAGKKELPLVPMRELVVFPHMAVPFYAGRALSISAIEESTGADRLVFLAPQKNDKEDPGQEDLYDAGTVAKVLQMMKLPDGTVRVLAEGHQRATLKKVARSGDHLQATVSLIEVNENPDPVFDPLQNTVRDSFERYVKFQKKSSPEINTAVQNAEYPDKLVDLVCANTGLHTEKKVELLRISDRRQRLELLAEYLQEDIEVLSLQDTINERVKKKLESHQKEYYLNEQLRQINKELGHDDQDDSGAGELRKRIQAKNPPQEVLDKAEKELKRLGRLQPMSPESGVLRTYLEWIADLPWSEKSEDNVDISRAEQVLDEDHYDMQKPKERVLDFLAVRQLQEKSKGPILCFVGPPGTGKTSLGRSLARAMNREFIRISLGGVRDEAEIRGHRKTYVGALPGKIVQSMRKAGTINPVFLLDEVDKLSSDFRGDPASALLEVLDPEQNFTFIDHYLEVPYDLSSIMFITTANSIHSVPYALRDRMEVIEIPGYTDQEKERIAKQFIIPKQLRENGLSWANVTFRHKALMKIIREYTMESGVRNLERQIAAVIRKVARSAVKKGYVPQEGGETPRFGAAVTEANLSTYLGPPQYEPDLVYRQARPGLAHGLAWTELGGKMLPVEVSMLPGEGNLLLTGSLGDVMKESARIGLSFLRANADTFGINPEFQKETDIHIHVPQGAIPKDGPSAGITITAALLSAVAHTPVRSCTAMTGEVTLTGRLLAVGGIKEKVLAAHRNNLTTVLLPEENRKDLSELPSEIREEITFVFAESIRDALLRLFPHHFDTKAEVPAETPNEGECAG